MIDPNPVFLHMRVNPPGNFVSRPIQFDKGMGCARFDFDNTSPVLVLISNTFKNICPTDFTISVNFIPTPGLFRSNTIVFLGKCLQRKFGITQFSHNIDGSR